MKKITVHMSLLLAITLLLSTFLCSTPVYAAGFEVEIGSVQMHRGGIATVPIYFKNVPAVGVNSCDFEVIYNTAFLEVWSGDGVTAGPIVRNSSETFDCNIDAKSGTIKFLYSDETGLGTEAVTSDGIFANIKFSIKSNAQTGFNKIKITGDPVFGNISLEYIETAITDGSLEVVEMDEYRISGYILPDLISGSKADAVLRSGFSVEIADRNKRTLTDENGYFEIYTGLDLKNCSLLISKDGFLCREIKDISLCNTSGFTDISTETAPIIMWIGDINMDNAINMADIMELSTAFNSSRDSSIYKSGYDVNKDDAVNMEDIMAIVQHFNKVPDDYR